MIFARNTWRVEMTQASPVASFGVPAPVDVTARVFRDGFGFINRAMERNLLNFKTGDLTLTLRNRDGYFDTFFAFLGPTDRWTLKVFRGGATSPLFAGVVMGLGSVRFNRKEKQCELTAYGASRLLVDSSAAVVARGPVAVLTAPGLAGSKVLVVDNAGGFAVGDAVWTTDGLNAPDANIVSKVLYPNQIALQFGLAWNESVGAVVSRLVNFLTVTTAVATQTTLTINDTTGLSAGDVLHLTDQVNKEDVTVKQVTSGTALSLTAALLNSYAAGSPVTLSTPFLRYKTIDYLAQALFRSAGVPVAEVSLSGSQFRSAAPTPVSLDGVDLTGDITCPPSERNGRRYQLVKFGAGAGATGKMIYEASPDTAWVQEDTTKTPWVDWSRYFRQGDAAPAVLLRSSLTPETDTSVDGFGMGWQVPVCGWDFKGSPKVQWALDVQAPGQLNLKKITSNDGVTWGAKVVVQAMPNSTAVGSAPDCGCELDPVRQQVYCSYESDTLSEEARLYDINGATLSNLKQGDDVAATRYFGFCYVADMDYVVCLRGTSKTGPAFEIAAFRNGARLWKRPFPRCTVKADVAVASYNYPTMSMRFVNGGLYCLVMSDGAIQLAWSFDEWKSYGMRKIADNTTKGRYFGARISGRYAISCYQGTQPTGHMVAAPLYAGVIPYADFSSKGSSEGLSSLGQLANAVWWTDDDLQGHFVARDLYPAGEVLDVNDRVKEENDVVLWDQNVQYVEVSGGSGGTQVAGNKAFAASKLSVSSPFIPNEAFAQALADSYYAFFGTQRAYKEAILRNRDGQKMIPMRRLTRGGKRWLVYQSNDAPTGDSVTVQLLEDV